MKRTLSIFLVVMLVAVIFTGCSGKENSDTGKTGANSANTKTKGEDVGQTVSKEEIVGEWWIASIIMTRESEKREYYEGLMAFRYTFEADGSFRQWDIVDKSSINNCTWELDGNKVVITTIDNEVWEVMKVKRYKIADNAFITLVWSLDDDTVIFELVQY